MVPFASAATASRPSPLIPTAQAAAGTGTDQTSSPRTPKAPQVPVGSQHKGPSIRSYRDTAGSFVLFEGERFSRELGRNVVPPIPQRQAHCVGRAHLAWRISRAEPARAGIEPGRLAPAFFETEGNSGPIRRQPEMLDLPSEISDIGWASQHPSQLGVISADGRVSSHIDKAAFGQRDDAHDRPIRRGQHRSLDPTVVSPAKDR